jgi:hypothetical protein
MYIMVYIHQTTSRFEQYQKGLPRVGNKAYTCTLGSYIQGLDVSKHGTSRGQSGTGGTLQRRGPSKTNEHHLAKERRPEGTVA